MVAFGAHGGASKLEIMKITLGSKNDLSLKKWKCFNIGLTSALTHLDWSIGSDFIVANS